MNTLSEIYEKYKGDGSGAGQDGDKGNVHSYVPIYEEKLAPYRLTTKNILEIGVSAGLSMRMWEKYFPSAYIFGIDNNPSCQKSETPRTTIIIADSTNPISTLWGHTFDVIIDDGSHYPSDQIRTFENLFTYLNPNGVYFIEDVSGIEEVTRTISTNTKDIQILVHDFRKNKGRHDDVLIEIRKNV